MLMSETRIAAVVRDDLAVRQYVPDEMNTVDLAVREEKRLGDKITRGPKLHAQFDKRTPAGIAKDSAERQHTRGAALEMPASVRAARVLQYVRPRHCACCRSDQRRYLLALRRQRRDFSRHSQSHPCAVARSGPRAGIDEERSASTVGAAV